MQKVVNNLRSREYSKKNASIPFNIHVRYRQQADRGTKYRNSLRLHKNVLDNNEKSAGERFKRESNRGSL